MAYAAVISLKQTIRRLLNSSHIFTVPPKTRKAIQSAYEELESLQEVVERLDIRSDGSNRSSDRVTLVDGLVSDAVCKIEVALETHISDQFLQNQQLRGGNLPFVLSINWKKILMQELGSFSELKEEYLKELANPAAINDVVHDDEPGEIKSRVVVGLSAQFSQLKDHLLRGRDYCGKVVSVVGMAGIGKTTLARTVFEDPKVLGHFKCRAWVKVGPKYRLKEIVWRILNQVASPEMFKSGLMLKQEDLGEGDLRYYLNSSMMCRRYLIVLDDVWSVKVWDDLARFLPHLGYQCRVLVTTRLQRVSEHLCRSTLSSEKSSSSKHQIQMHLLDIEESWRLLRGRVFGEHQFCPPQLEKAGKKIAEKCDGLPLTIVTVAKLLAKEEKTVEFWTKVAIGQNSIFVEAYDEISKVLVPSYHHLPQYLKPCFLYMVVFPQKYDISTSKLLKLWTAEGFVETNQSITIGYFTAECLNNFVSDNILMIRQRSYDGRIKTCYLHSAFWQMCTRVARENKFLHVLNSYDDALEERIKGHSRLCIHNNVLFGIKDVNNSMASISTAHSLLCTGPYHQYPVPLCLGLRLLRVLDALTIRLYEFPVEVVNLFHLRYLALTCNGKLPASISKLWNLQFLIVRQHLSIKLPTHTLYLPEQIWDMQELTHLQIMGSDLPYPSSKVFLQNLSTLLDVSPRSLTEGFLVKIRGLKKLGVRIELAPDANELLTCFHSISNLSLLESLKCIVVNPVLTPEIVAPPSALLLKLPSRLKKLSLSGFGYGWDNMSKIASLPNLEVLKIRCYAFRGSEWRTGKEKFSKLEYLLIEDTDLVHWRGRNRCFPSLKCLIIRHCYNLKEIPQMSRYSKLQKIEVVESNPSVVTWAMQEREEIKDRIQPSFMENLDSILKVKEIR